jgi:hypothetical protein
LLGCFDDHEGGAAREERARQEERKVEGSR